MPPHWPFPASSTLIESTSSIESSASIEAIPTSIESTSIEPILIQSVVNVPPEDCTKYEPITEIPEQPVSAGCFPVFPAGESVLAVVRQAIAGAPQFVERRHDHWLAYDYVSLLPGLFEGPHAAVRRELRGLLVCPSRGVVLARRFHKFFNLSELPETRPHSLPPITNDDAVVLEKLDGSLVSPVVAADGSLHWASRGSPTPAVALFVAAQHPRCGYLALVEEALRKGYTALFEWRCTQSTVGVIAASSDSLTLLALRHLENGLYLPHRLLCGLASAFRVPCARSFSLSEIFNLPPSPSPLFSSSPSSDSTVTSLARQVRKWNNAEGVVVRWESSGLMVKVKS
ncbi:MAG: T4 RnlA family RNA ligase, partial [archaeon]|nr:T4 RnlA family RNA ligase [archaeon]